MIKRITNPVEFKKLLDDIFVLIKNIEDRNEAHFLKHNEEYISNAFAHKHLLVWDFFVWANEDDDGNFDAMIAFVNEKNEKFGEEIFSEYLWLSDNPRVGHKLLGVALKFAKEKEFKYVIMNCVSAHPKAEKVARFYKKMGFVKDSESYIAEL